MIYKKVVWNSNYLIPAQPIRNGYVLFYSCEYVIH